MPVEFNNLGLAAARLEEHIAYDIGAGDVARRLADKLNCRAILCRTSRLLIDCNRLLEDPTLIPETSDGVVIPGNRGLDFSERQARIEAFFKPYHGEIRRQIEWRLQRRIIPAIISIHSFTPALAGMVRPWQVGVLWDRDPRVAPKLIEHLRRDANLVVGDNQPYSGVDPHGYALKTYGADLGLPTAIIEIRQDLIENSQSMEFWAEKLAECLRHVLSDRYIFRIERE